MRTTLKPLIALSAVALLVLTGCSGAAKASGTYYGTTEVKKSGSDLAVATIDGDTLTWSYFSCDSSSPIDTEDRDTSIGTLDKERVNIAWVSPGRWSNTDPFTESEDGSVVTIGGGNYSKEGTPAGDAIKSQLEEKCQKDIDDAAAAESKAVEDEAWYDEVQSEMEDYEEELQSQAKKLWSGGSESENIDPDGLYEQVGAYSDFDRYTIMKYGMTPDDYIAVLLYSDPEFWSEQLQDIR